MSHNLAFQYVRDLLLAGPATGDDIKHTLTRFRPDQIDTVLAWAVDNGSLVLDQGVYTLTDRGRR